MYGLGLAERELGNAFRARRQEVTIATKVGIRLTPVGRALGLVQGPVRLGLQAFPSLRTRARSSGSGPGSGPLGSLLYREAFDMTAAKRSLDRSLRALATDYVDIFLLHDPPVSVDAPMLHGLLEQARTTGRIRTWGLAGDPEPLQRVMSALPGPSPVVQMRDDIVEPGLRVQPTVDTSYPIAFGVLGRALSFIQSRLGAGDTAATWAASLGDDFRKPEFLADLLLMDALDAMPEATVLVSTLRPHRIVRALEVANSQDAWDRERLMSFRSLVSRQLTEQDSGERV